MGGMSFFDRKMVESGQKVGKMAKNWLVLAEKSI